MKCLVEGCTKNATRLLVAKVEKITMKGKFCSRHYSKVKNAKSYDMSGQKLKG